MKIDPNVDQDVIYTKEHWDLFKSLREKATRITGLFADRGFETLTFGSIARGDVKPTSDIDIILTVQISSYQVELILEEAHEEILHKYLIQATPNDVIKGHLELNDNTTITIVLSRFTHTPFEFYKFGGAVTHEQLMKNERVPGVDKRLVLIQPNELGHHETSIVENPSLAIDTLKIAPDMVNQRIRVLTRRDKVGRTGIFLNKELDTEDNFEQKLDELAQKNPLIRRRLNM